MSTVEDGAAHQPTLREQVNAQRIGRARFTGNFLGMLLFAVAILVGVMLAGLKEPLALPMPRPANAPPLTMPNHWAILVVLTVLLLGLLDLGVRRRHDRGAHGWGVLIWVLLLGGSLYAHALGLVAAEMLRWGDIGLGIISLYFIVVLALLPGKRKINRYGPPAPLSPHI